MFVQASILPDQALLTDRRFEDRNEMNIKFRGTGTSILAWLEDKHDV